MSPRGLAVVLVLAPAALAHADLTLGEDPATFPQGVLAVGRMPVHAAGELQVEVSTEGNVTGGSMFVCRFPALDAAEPDVCWRPVQATPHGGVLVARSTPDSHPPWAEGTVVGYRLALGVGNASAAVPIDGGYYKLVVEPGESRGAAGPLAAALALALLAGAVARRGH